MARKKNFNTNETLEKAMNLFWEKGYHATSMQDLVDELKINRASIYATYGSKAKLFKQALSLYHQNQAKRIAEFLYQYVNVRQGLYALFQAELNASFDANLKMGCFLSNSIAELSNSDLELNEDLIAHKAALEIAFLNYLQYGVGQGQISPYKDIHSISNYLYIMHSGLQTISKLNASQEELIKSMEIGLSVID